MTSRGKFRWGNTMELPCETLINEYIISSNSLWFRKVKQCLHAIYSKTFYICDYFLFLTRNSQDKASCFIKTLSVKSVHSSQPTFQIAESDLLKITSYIDPTGEIDQSFSITKRSIKVGKLYKSILLRVWQNF